MLRTTDVARSSKVAQNAAAQVRAAAHTAVAFVETQVIALRDDVAKPVVAKTRVLAPVYGEQVKLGAKCAAAATVSFFRTLVGR